MKILTTVTNESEAQMIVASLKSAGIAAESQGAKDYASIIVGSDQGRYQIFVDENDFESAEKFLQSMQRSHLSIADEEPATPNYFKRAAIMATLAMVMLPIVFNIVSLMSARKYWAHSTKDSEAKFKLVLLFLFQLPSLGSAYLLWLTFSSGH